MGISYVRIQTQLLKICINFNCTNVNVIEPKSDSIQRCLEKYDAICVIILLEPAILLLIPRCDDVTSCE